MKKILGILIGVIFLTGCQNTTTPREVTKNKSREEIFEQQHVQNALWENFSLLAIKYGINKELLAKIIYEYEEMTFGVSFTKTLHEGYSETPKFDFSNIVDPSSAVEKLSIKYQIQKETLVSIIIDKKMLEGINNE